MGTYDQDKKLAQMVLETHKSMRFNELSRDRPFVKQRKTLQLEEQLLKQQQARSSLSSQAFQIVQRGQQAMVARQQALLKYQAATGQLVKQDAQLQRWKQRLDKEKDSLQESQDGSPVSRRLKSFRILLPFDIVAARQQLDQSLQFEEISE